jgi:hypothetical protein
MIGGYMTLGPVFDNPNFPRPAKIFTFLSIFTLFLLFSTKYYIVDLANNNKTLLIPSTLLCISAVIFTLASFEGLRHISTFTNHWNDNPDMYKSYKTYPIHILYAWIVLFIPSLNFWAAFKSKRLFYILLPFSIYLALSFIFLFTPLRYTLRPVFVFIYNTLITNIQPFLS